MNKRLSIAIGCTLILLSGTAWGEESTPPGVITYQLPEGHFYRVAAQEDAAPEDLSLALDALAPSSEDDWLNIAPDGAWLLLSTDRFDPACAGWPCLALVAADLSAYEVPQVDGEPIHPASRGAVASGGDLIVYPQGDGPHTRDLLAITRGAEGAWSVPLLLTADSPHAWNDMPALSEDGTRVVFDCGDEPYGAAGTAICEANADGTGVTVIVSPDAQPSEDRAALHHPDYAPDGAVIFEANWGNSERIWSLAPDRALPPVLLTEAFGNDNSPCVLPDGRIVSLWLGRADNGPGDHEIKAMPPEGSRYAMVLTGIDVLDGGLGCGAGPLVPR